MIVERVIVEGEFITVSLVVWRRFKRHMPGLVEQIYDINRELAELGPYLPLGTAFDMPIPTPRPVSILDPVKLW